MPNYGSYEYWNTRYTKEQKAMTTFDWLECYKDIR